MKKALRTHLLWHAARERLDEALAANYDRTPVLFSTAGTSEEHGHASAAGRAYQAGRRAAVQSIRDHIENFEHGAVWTDSDPVPEELWQDVNWNKGYVYFAEGIQAILDREAGVGGPTTEGGDD